MREEEKRQEVEKGKYVKYIYIYRYIYMLD